MQTNLSRRSRVGARYGATREEIVADPNSTTEELANIPGPYDRVLMISHHNCPTARWWWLAAQLPIEAIRSPLFSLLTLESPERWAELERKHVVTWITAGLTHLDEQQQRLFAADCAAHVLHFWEEIFPGNLYPRQAIAVARQFAEGAATLEQLQEAYSNMRHRASPHFGYAHREMAAQQVALSVEDAAAPYGSDQGQKAANWAAKATSVALRLSPTFGAPQDYVAMRHAEEDERIWQWHQLVNYIYGTAQPVVAGIDTVGERMPAYQPYLHLILGPKGSVPQIGPETGRPVTNGIAVYRGGRGSVRLILYHEKMPLSCLHVYKQGRGKAKVENVFTDPLWRRLGLAGKLMKYARKMFKTVVHSADLTPAGEKWSQAVGALAIVGQQEEEPRLAYLLQPKGTIPQIGPETGREMANGVAIYKSPHGSVRLVLYQKKEPVAALQLVDLGNGRAQTANVYTVPEKRRLGLASELLTVARQMFTTVTHSEDRSPAGAAWVEKVGATNRSPKEIMTDPLADEDDIVRATQDEPWLALNHPNCTPEIWWDAAHFFPFQAIQSMLFPMMTLEAPERWEALERDDAASWINDYLGHCIAPPPLLSSTDLHLFVIDCVEHVMPLWTACFPNDTRPQDALDAAKQWLAGEITADQMQRASMAALEASTKPPLRPAVHCATYVAQAAQLASAPGSAKQAVESAAYAVYAKHMPRASAFEAHRDETVWQWHRLVQYLLRAQGSPR